MSPYCEWIRLPDGTAVLVRRGGTRQLCSVCRQRYAAKLCDGPPRAARRKTCDAPLCDSCAVNVAPDRDLCPEHSAAAETHP